MVEAQKIARKIYRRQKGKIKSQRIQPSQPCRHCGKNCQAKNCKTCRSLYDDLGNTAKKISNNHGIIAGLQHHEHRKLLPGRCEVCGHDVVTDVHHINEDRSNNMPRNLVRLCPTHHMMIHRADYTVEELFKHQGKNVPRRIQRCARA